jgi:hypothetical protein
MELITAPQRSRTRFRGAQGGLDDGTGEIHSAWRVGVLDSLAAGNLWSSRKYLPGLMFL